MGKIAELNVGNEYTAKVESAPVNRVGFCPFARMGGKVCGFLLTVHRCEGEEIINELLCITVRCHRVVFDTQADDPCVACGRAVVENLASILQGRDLGRRSRATTHTWTPSGVVVKRRLLR